MGNLRKLHTLLRNSWPSAQSGLVPCYCGDALPFESDVSATSVAAVPVKLGAQAAPAPRHFSHA